MCVDECVYFVCVCACVNEYVCVLIVCVDVCVCLYLSVDTTM